MAIQYTRVSLKMAFVLLPSKLAVAYLGLGDRKRAFEWLWRAVEAHDDRLVYLAVVYVFTGLHPNPEFRRIDERVGLADVLEPN